MTLLPLNRRRIGKGLATGLLACLVSGPALADSSTVVATFPNTRKEAYRKIIMPILAEQDIDLTIAPALTTLQIGNSLAASKAGAPPPYDALLLSPGDTAVALATT